MRKLNPEEYFYVCNGEILKSKKDLLELLNRIDDTIFSYHVNESKNDFANWIRDVFKNLVLSSKLRSAKTPLEMVQIIQEDSKSKDKIEKKNIIHQIKEAFTNNG